MKNILIAMLLAILVGVGVAVYNYEAPTPRGPLPKIGFAKMVDGAKTYPTIPNFAFYNQDSLLITNADYAGKAYITYSFFTSCPSICPKTTKSMLRLYESFKENTELMFVGYTLDPKRDNVGHLKSYSNNLGLDSKQFHFLTGDQFKLIEHSKALLISAVLDPSAPGGIDHSGQLVLVDGEGHIRAFCNGTKETEVTRFFADIDLLLAEMRGEFNNLAEKE